MNFFPSYYMFKARENKNYMLHFTIMSVYLHIALYFNEELYFLFPLQRRHRVITYDLIHPQNRPSNMFYYVLQKTEDIEVKDLTAGHTASRWFPRTQTF